MPRKTAPTTPSSSPAQLREQNPIDVPMTLSVLTGEELDRFGIQEFDELSRFVPGFEFRTSRPTIPAS